MSNYIIDKYDLPNKWVAEDFEKLQALMEKAQKEKDKKKDGNKVRVPSLSR